MSDIDKRLEELVDDSGAYYDGLAAALLRARKALEPITRLDDRPLSIMEARDLARDAANALADPELEELMR